MVSLCNKQDIITYQIKASTVLDFERNAIVLVSRRGSDEVFIQVFFSFSHSI